MADRIGPVYTMDGISIYIGPRGRHWEVSGVMASITFLSPSERVSRAVFAAAPVLTYRQVERALRAAHKIDRAGGSDAEVKIACYPSPTAKQLIEVMRPLRGVGASLRLPGGVVVRYEHEADLAAPGTPPWLSATKRGSWSLRPQDRDQLAHVLAFEYEQAVAGRVS